MGGLRRHFLLVGVVTTAFAIALFLGAAERGQANTESGCAGKPLCVDITDQGQTGANEAPASLSIGSDHYLSESIKVYYDTNSGATSNLVNLKVNVNWEDVGASLTTAYRPQFSQGGCTEASAGQLTCPTPKSLGAGGFVTYDLVFRTATNTAATSTKVTAMVSAKEQAPPKKVGSDNNAFVNRTNETSYEPFDDLDVSIAGGGISTFLATQQTGVQWSKLPIPAQQNLNRSLFTLSEGEATGCPTGFDCFGQQVTTVAVGLAPVNLQITFTGRLPSGAKESNLVVFHQRVGDNDPTPISATCSGALFSGTPDPSSQIPCRRVSITHLTSGNELVQIDAWDLSNGGWGVGAPR